MFSESEAYERFMGRWSRQLEPAFVEFAGVRNASEVLDVGSGTGALTAAVLSMSEPSRVVGVDPSVPAGRRTLACASTIPQPRA
jgi:ubiquinone/menaquinone biosynthesis C-methylase UbiE